MVVEEFGSEHWYPRFIKEPFRTIVRQSVQEYPSRELKAERDAEIRVEEAKGIAEAQKIINATLTPNYLQHEAIQAQRTMANAPNHTTVYIPCGHQWPTAGARAVESARPNEGSFLAEPSLDGRGNQG